MHLKPWLEHHIKPFRISQWLTCLSVAMTTTPACGYALVGSNTEVGGSCADDKEGTEMIKSM